MQRSAEIIRSEGAKRLKPLASDPEFNELLEAIKAAKSEPAFKQAIEEFRKKHTGA